MTREAAARAGVDNSLPKWGQAAKLAYRAGLGVFAVIWLCGILFGVRPEGSSPAWVAWIVTGALSLLALLLWLASEFISGLRDRT